MKKSLLPTLFPLLVLTANAAPPEKAPVQMIVKLKSTMSEASFKGILSARGGSQSGSIPALNARVIRVPAEASDTCRSELRGHRDVEYVEPDYTAEAQGTANDPYYTQGSEWHLAKIQAPAAWDVSTGSSSVVVAVVDTGGESHAPGSSR